MLCVQGLETGRKRGCAELFIPVSSRVQITFIFRDNVWLFFIYCNSYITVLNELFRVKTIISSFWAEDAKFPQTGMFYK